LKSFEKQLAERITFKPFKAKKMKDQFGLETWADETREKIRPGTVMRMKDKSIQIVGDCNALFGVCNDCTEYDYDQIIEIAHIEQLLGKKSKRK